MDELQTITVTDDEGKEIKLQLLDIAQFEGNEYALLLGADANLEDEDTEVTVMRLNKGENDEYTFETIEDDEEFERISNAIMSEIEEMSEE